MGSCDRFEMSWDEADASDRRALREHAAGCGPCGAAAERQAAYEAAISVARQELLAGDDLPSDAWVRLRDGIDQGLERRHRRASLIPILAGLAAAAVVVFAVGWPDTVDPSAPADHVERVATTAARSPQIVAPAGDTLARRARAEAPRAAFTEGQTLTSGAAARTIVAFERHVLTLAPNSELVLSAWSPEGVELALQRGSVRCDVQRASTEEQFRVRTASAAISVLGTAFTVGINGDGATSVEVEHGVVEVQHGEQVEQLTAQQWGRFGGAMAAGDEARARDAQGATSGARSSRGGSRGELKIIEIDVPAAKMARPSVRPRPEPAKAKVGTKSDEVKLIDILVPPQRDDGVRQ